MGIEETKSLPSNQVCGRWVCTRQVSPKTKETSQRLTVLVDSTIVDGTADPFIANNEHLDKYLQEPVDEYIEQAGKDDPPYLSAPRAVSDHLEAGTLDLGEPTVAPYLVSIALTIEILQNPPPIITRLKATLYHDRKQSAGVQQTWNRIAGPENLAQLWHCLWAKRGSPSNEEPESTPETSDPSDTRIEGQLRRAAQKNAKERRKRNRGLNRDAANTPRKSVFDVFVDSLLPELLKEDTDTREKAKTRFDNWIQHGKRWAKLIERFGSGILLLISQDLSNDNLRSMQLPEVDTLVEHLDSYRPSLKADIQNLTSLLSPLIEDQCLPAQRLQLEILTESQIASGEHTTRSLKELFEYSDDYSSFLIEIARSDLSQPNTEVSTDPLASFGGQAGGITALPSPYILNPDDLSITLYTDYLSSPTS
ncbi:hypothetical protein F5882DRAFT_381432 [Hyaloscypha sp. PMI_1271]|nr:hypothetical protein F5882DRAFT_381432 [Hyaloscypha sp. PMI_1271]